MRGEKFRLVKLWGVASLFLSLAHDEFMEPRDQHGGVIALLLDRFTLLLGRIEEFDDLDFGGT